VHPCESGDKVLVSALLRYDLNPMIPNLELMSRAIQLSHESMNSLHGGPFAAIIVKDGEIISEGTNSVTAWNDPTAHAEVVAIRRACTKLQTFQLTGCDIYSTCEPCAMCLGAIYWARPRALYFAAERTDAAQAGFDDRFIYEQLALPLHERRLPTVQTMREEAALVLKEWASKPGKQEY
jgi:tRNA(Arg) A34 adenosine deaminase TadA